MPPQPAYSLMESSRSPSHIENSERDYEDDDDYEEENGATPPMRGARGNAGREEEVKRRTSVKEEKAPINALINVFEHKRKDQEE